MVDHCVGLGNLCGRRVVRKISGAALHGSSELSRKAWRLTEINAIYFQEVILSR